LPVFDSKNEQIFKKNGQNLANFLKNEQNLVKIASNLTKFFIKSTFLGKNLPKKCAFY
jgi:hypothetical protein